MPADPRQSSLFDADPLHTDAGFKGAPRTGTPCPCCTQTGRPLYRHGCCGETMCAPCHAVEQPGGFACIPAAELKAVAS